jgi:hypothetical protein
LLAPLNGSDQIAPAIGGFYFWASGRSVTLPASRYNYSSDWTPLLVRLSLTGMAARLAAPTPASNRPRSVPSPPGRTRSPSASSATPQDRPLSCRMSGTRELPYHRHDPHAGEDRLLVHIKTGNPLMHHIHRSFLHTCAAGVGTSHRRILVTGLRGQRCRTLGVQWGVRATRVQLRTKEKPTSVPAASNI